MCNSGYGDPSFTGALFVVHPGRSDGRVHGPFFLIEDALRISRNNSVVYKEAALTHFESNYTHRVAPTARWLSPSTFIPKPTPKTKRARASKLVAMAKLQANAVYYAVLRDSQHLLRCS